MLSFGNGLVLKAIHRDLAFFLKGSYSALITHGWAADVAGYFGYAVNLTTDRTYKVILTPLLGYGANFEQLDQLPGFFHLVWNGVFLGGGFTIEPGSRLVFDTGYTYHFMHNRVHTETIRTSSHGNKGHTGWAQMDWKLDSFWRFGLGAQIHYFFTRVVDATENQMEEKFKLRDLYFRF